MNEVCYKITLFFILFWKSNFVYEPFSHLIDMSEFFIQL